MFRSFKVIVFILLATSFSGCSQQPTNSKATQDSTYSESELRKRLTQEQYQITQEKATELPYSGAYVNNHEVGTYYCVVCHTPLFLSDTKFDSGCGWPSFFKAIDNKNIIETTDNTLGMSRTEITCAKCGAHLGHVFNDGPPPTGLRYCLNSGVMIFIKK